MGNGPKQVNLVCHPSSSCGDIQSISARLSWERGILLIAYAVHGDVARLKLPMPKAAGFADGLWEHTCFEAFIREEGDPRYIEYNFSPSLEWAVYEFEDYRIRGTSATRTEPPRIQVSETRQGLELMTSVDLQANYQPGSVLELGLSAVIESVHGLSYWAICHPQPKPDFHHRDSFVETITVPDSTHSG